jgi:hypothetical protein
MKPEIVIGFKQEMQREVSELLDSIAGMSDIMEINFS